MAARICFFLIVLALIAFAATVGGQPWGPG